MSIITILYYAISAYLAALCVWNFVREKRLQEAAMYAVVLVPLLLRVFRIK
ncbi:MAG: hypothetical protein VB144_09900 [Clostridia bacterium]|nr:hypothetical protein [Clostridia bacterium]